MHSDEIRALYESLPELPVLLIGGVSHNQVIHVDEAGPAVQVLKVAVPRRKSALFAPGETVTEIHEYAYDRLSDDDHMYHYKFLGRKP